MCIICRCDDVGGTDHPGDDYLIAHALSQRAMEDAAAAMLACYAKSRHRPYDRAHKRMVALIRDWNRIEQEREAEDQEHTRPTPPSLNFELGDTGRTT